MAKQFITAKNRKALISSIDDLRAELFSGTNTVDDEKILYTLEEAKKKIDHSVEYLRTARLYKSFEETKGKSPL